MSHQTYSRRVLYMGRTCRSTDLHLWSLPCSCPREWRRRGVRRAHFTSESHQIVSSTSWEFWSWKWSSNCIDVARQIHASKVHPACHQPDLFNSFHTSLHVGLEIPPVKKWPGSNPRVWYWEARCPFLDTWGYSGCSEWNRSEKRHPMSASFVPELLENWMGLGQSRQVKCLLKWGRGSWWWSE